MVDVTLLELDVDDVQFSTGGPSGDADSGADADERPASDETGRSWVAAAVGLLFLVLLAALVKRRIGDEA
jgi:MYXO-CTERM domain-containing protein